MCSTISAVPAFLLSQQALQLEGTEGIQLFVGDASHSQDSKRSYRKFSFLENSKSKMS